MIKNTNKKAILKAVGKQNNDMDFKNVSLFWMLCLPNLFEELSKKNQVRDVYFDIHIKGGRRGRMVMSLGWGSEGK